MVEAFPAAPVQQVTAESPCPTLVLEGVMERSPGALLTSPSPEEPVPSPPGSAWHCQSLEGAPSSSPAGPSVSEQLQNR